MCSEYSKTTILGRYKLPGFGWQKHKTLWVSIGSDHYRDQTKPKPALSRLKGRGNECQALTQEHIMAECPLHASSIMVNKISLHLEMVIDRVGLAKKQSLLMCSACILAHIVITYTLGDQWLVHK